MSQQLQSLAYGLDKKSQDLKIAVFDLGGGTFDISFSNLVMVFLKSNQLTAILISEATILIILS